MYYELEPSSQYLDVLLQHAIDNSVSDIHIEPEFAGARIRLRIDGELSVYNIITRELYHRLVNRIKVFGLLDITQSRLPQDGVLALTNAGARLDVRISVLPSMYGEKVVLRLLFQNSAYTTLESLGLPQKLIVTVKKLVQTEGLVLVTGPTGSGKTTTLYAALRECNPHTQNITTLEDPVEYHYRHSTQTSMVENVFSFESAIPHVLRQDPDVILVGEIRDAKTAQAALRAALTGHLVLSSLHSSRALFAIPRLVDMGIDRYLIADSVVLVIAQRLVPMLCSECKTSVRGVWSASGCFSCKGTGVSSRIPLAEWFTMTPALRQAIIDGASVAHLEKIASRCGMVTFEDTILTLQKEGIVASNVLEKIER